MGALRRLGFSLVLSAFVVMAVSAVFAEDDPPGRAARLDYMSGEVSIQPGGVNDWVAATLNRPMTTSDRIWTDKDSRAEVQVGSGTLRLDSETSLTFSNVADNTVQVELDQGTLNLHIFDLNPGEIYEIDTPNTAFTITKRGDYRFDVNSNNDVSLVTVWRGEGVATGDGPGVKVKGGQQASFSGGRSMAHTVYDAPNRTGFDDWCAVRDKRQDSSESARYVNRGVVGYQDLDTYGRWTTYPNYGAVWVPTVVTPGWAPYRFGHWVWVAPWGWTWVDDAPWGYAPFHYGRWAYIGGTWGWCPGPVYARPVYAPALVAWVGGPNWGVSIGIGGGVGWFPLGYGEPYVPWYHAGPGYWRNVNVSNTRITNVTVINNYYNHPNEVNNIHYANRMRPNAVTAMPERDFVNSRPVNRNMVPVSTQSLRDARVVGRTPYQPNRDSVLGANAGRQAAIPPQRAFARQPVRNMVPPAAPKSPFGNERTNAANGNNPANAGPSHMPQRGNDNAGPQRGQERIADTQPNNRVPRPPSRMDDGQGSGRTWSGNNNNVGPTAPGNNAGHAAPGNDNVVRHYPHPPSPGERQAMNETPSKGANNPPTRTYSQPPQGNANDRNYSRPPQDNANSRTYPQQPQGNANDHSYSRPPQGNNGRPASGPPSNESNRSYGPPANQGGPHTYSAPPSNQGGPHTYSAPPSQSPGRTYSPPPARNEGNAPAAQPHSHPQESKPNNDRTPKSSSLYGGDPAVASNYSYPRPSSGAASSSPASSYSSPRTYNSAPERGYSSPSAGYSQRSYPSQARQTYQAAPSRPYEYSQPARSSAYSAPSRAYTAQSYGGGRSYSAPERSYSAPSRNNGGGGNAGGGRSYSAPHSSGSSAHNSGGGHEGGGSARGH